MRNALPLDEMFINLVNAIYLPGLSLLVLVSFIAGIWYILKGVVRLTDSRAGAQGQLGMGTAMTFFVGTVLISLGFMMVAFTESLFGTSDVQRYAVLAYSQGDTQMAERANQVLNAALKFVQLVGYIAFVRGWMILRAQADGANVSTLGAFVHIIGGALAVNMAPLIRAFQETVGLEIIR